MKKLKVLHIISALNGGAGTILLRYCDRLREVCEFDFAVNYEADFNWNTESVNKTDSHIIIFTRYYKNIFRFTKELNTIIRDGKYDVVFSHLGYTSFIPMLLAKRNGVKYRYAHSHTSNMPNGIIKNVIKEIRAFLTRQAAYKVTACGVNSAIWTWGRKQYEKGNVPIIYNALPTEKFAYSDELRKKYRDQFCIDKQTKACVCVARLSFEKNQIFLINLWDKIRKIDNNIKLYLVGNGDQADLLRKTIYENGLNNNVFILGPHKNVNEILSAFDLFLLPSLFEGVPLTLVEAQANGMPIIASTNVSEEVGITELVHFEPLKEQSWIDAILRLAPINNESRISYLEIIKKKNYDIEIESSKIKRFIKNKFITEQ